MLQQCIKNIIICVSFFIFSFGLFYLSGATQSSRHGDYHPKQEPIQIRLMFSNVSNPECQYQCSLNDISEKSTWPHKTPSLESLIRASSAVEGQELHFSGLAVFSNLTDACQPLVGVSKSNIHVNKIALIYIANQQKCPLSDMVVNAQNAGYSVVLYVTDSHLPSTDNGTQNNTQDKLLIPVLNIDYCSVVYPSGRRVQGSGLIVSSLLDADRRNVEITELQNTEVLIKMERYLKRLYYWFLLGPLITFEWLRRTKKFCCMSGGQQVNEERGNEDEDTVGETNQHSVIEETRGNDDQEIDHGQTGNEEQPLIIVVNYPQANRTTLIGHTGYQAIRRHTTRLAEMFGKFAVGCGYVILIVVALPVGISSGGWSFFRFDENENKIKSFWDYVFHRVQRTKSTNDTGSVTISTYYPLNLYNFIGVFVPCLPLLWSPLQIYCFFLYSWVSCKRTWTVPTNFSKLIRSDWFASNMYLLILGVVVPYCSFDILLSSQFIYFTTYNTVCTISNLFFIIILNKHKFVTRYIFYISVCMICAYIESDIVAVFYFIMNSQGSLVNIKLVALNTVAITLTLTLSLSSSMHIIRKLAKPQESLFEGLGEK